MSEYQIKPLKNERPSPQDLLDDLAQKGWKVEINLKGSPEAWEAIRFFRPAPPEEVECFLLYDAETSSYSITLPALPGPGAPELQFRVVESLQCRLQGKVYDRSLRRPLTQREWEDWASRYRPYRFLQGSKQEVFWRLFPAFVTVASVLFSIYGPSDKRLPALGLAVLAALATVGLLRHSSRD